MQHLDVDALRQIIENVEESIETQGIAVAARQKAELVAALYARSLSEGEIPGRMSTDQAVWMADAASL